MRALLALLLFAGPLLGQAPNGWAPIENGWAEIQVAPPTGTVTTTGTPASGQVALVSGATSITGDSGCTWTGTGYSFVMNVGGGVQATGGFGAGGWASFWGASNGGLTMGSGNLIGWDSATFHAGYNRTGIDLALSRPSTGLLLVEDGSGAARDLQARTGTFGTSVVTPLLVSGPGKSGTNVAGTNNTIQAEPGTGSATGSSIIFQTPTAGASGTTAQTQATRLTLDQNAAIFTGRVTVNNDLFVFTGGGPGAVISGGATIDGYNAMRVGYSAYADGASVASAFILPTTTSGAAVGAKWLGGNGTPEGAVAATVGSLYSRFDGGAGTTLYVKELGTGTTGWVAK